MQHQTLNISCKLRRIIVTLNRAKKITQIKAASDVEIMQHMLRPLKIKAAPDAAFIRHSMRHTTVVNF